MPAPRAADRCRTLAITAELTRGADSEVLCAVAARELELKMLTVNLRKPNLFVRHGFRALGVSHHALVRERTASGD